MTIMRRRDLLSGSAALALAAAGAAPARAASSLRIGYQKCSTLVLLRARGGLEPALGREDVSVEWKEFSAGPPMLEALNVGAIDFAATGEVPPVFAQAAGAAIVYVGAEPPAPEAEAIVVPKNSAIFSVSELRHKLIALNKGSNVYWLVLRALEDARLDDREVDMVFMAPSDARAAFQAGQLDAWAIWDPFLAAAEADLGARTLRDGSLLVSNREFYLATGRLAASQPKIVETILDQIRAVDSWASASTGAVVPALADALGLDEIIVGRVVSRRRFGVEPITPAILAAQQGIADAFTVRHRIPAPVRVGDAVWTPPA